MTCRQCRFFKQCLEDAVSSGQMFDPEYDGEHGCGAKRFSPWTNADRIRSMTDEELAELLCTADWCEVCDQLRESGTCAAMEMDGPLNDHCVSAGLRWLRQTAQN